MWLAFVMGVPQIVQPVWNARTRAARAQRLGWHVRPGRNAVFGGSRCDAVEDGERAPAALRIFVATGAAVPRSLAERATRILGAAVCGAWGTTESCLGIARRAVRRTRKGLGNRRARAAGNHACASPTPTDACLPPVKKGHFEVLSPTMFVGYADHPEWTAAAFTPDGWFRTGDLGVMDEAGYIRITGRVRDVINRGGEKIPVAEMEQLLGDHPVDRRRRDRRDAGSRVWANVPAPSSCCAAAAQLDFERMQHYLYACQASKHYWPERLEIVDELPRTPSGKIQKYRPARAGARAAAARTRAASIS